MGVEEEKRVFYFYFYFFSTFKNQFWGVCTFLVFFINVIQRHEFSNLDHDFAIPDAMVNMKLETASFFNKYGHAYISYMYGVMANDFQCRTELI